MTRSLLWAKRAVWPLQAAIEGSLRAEGIDLPVENGYGVVSVGRMHNITVIPCGDKEVGPEGRRQEVRSWFVHTPEKLYEPSDERARVRSYGHQSEECFGDQASAVRAVTKAAVALMRHPRFSRLEQISAENEAIRRANPDMDDRDVSWQWLRANLPCLQEGPEVDEAAQ